MTTGVSFAEASVMRAINKHQPELERAVTECLRRRMESHPGLSIVCGLWTARSLRESLASAVPIFYADAGVRGDHLYDTDDCLATNARFKASPCAQTRLDTLTMEEEPVHWIAVEGSYYPWGGAIIRSIDPVEFVVATSGLATGKEDHEISEVDVWPLVKAFAAKINEQNLVDADRDPSHPQYKKYLVGESSTRATPRS